MIRGSWAVLRLLALMALNTLVGRVLGLLADAVIERFRPRKEACAI